MPRGSHWSDVDRQESEEGGRVVPGPQRIDEGRATRLAPGGRALGPGSRGFQPAQDQVSPTGTGAVRPEAARGSEDELNPGKAVRLVPALRPVSLHPRRDRPGVFLRPSVSTSVVTRSTIGREGVD